MANNDVEKRLWEAADQLRANSKLKASEYSIPYSGSSFCATRTPVSPRCGRCCTPNGQGCGCGIGG